MPNKFTFRSDEKEMLDESNIRRDLLFKNLSELDTCSRFTGGHAILLKGIRQLITDHNKTCHVVDLGCGSGDALKTIANWARSNKYDIRLTGIDLNVNAIEYLKINCVNYPEITGITSDYRDYITANEPIDIVYCSLFCHHLTDAELLQLFIYFRQHIKKGFIINDLHRSWMAYYSVWLFTRLFNGTVLAKHDGPVSVLRGFKSGELVRLLSKAEIIDYTIQNEWAFRYLIIGKTNNHDKS